MTQFCIEEAVFERIHLEEMMERSHASAADLAGAGDPMQAARDFAEGRA